MSKSEQKNNNSKMDSNNMIRTKQKMLCKRVQNMINSKELNNSNQDNSLIKLKDIKDKIRKI